MLGNKDQPFMELIREMSRLCKLCNREYKNSHSLHSHKYNVHGIRFNESQSLHTDTIQFRNNK